jgi:glycosyltransferase involved in cell wall biosynthesis
MKLVMTLVVRNEADILQANLDYHLANGVDFVIATDHGSTDGTLEILRKYEGLGVLEAISDPQPGHHQGRRVTRMVELARVKHGADWVINNDADEFWWPLVGSLRDVFAAVGDRYAQIAVPRRNFRPVPDPALGEPVVPFHQRLVYREALSPNLVHQPKIAHRPLDGIAVAPGNHRLAPPGLPFLPLDGMLEIFHFPMRSYEQFERKVIQIGRGYELLNDRSPGVGEDQLRLLDLQRAGGLPAHYREFELDDDTLQRGLRSGAIVADRRLRNFMREPPRNRGCQRPDAPFAADLLAGAVGALVELQDNRSALAQAREEVRLWQGRAETSQARVDQLEAQIGELTGNLTNVTEALELVRNSRLMRHTAWARRIYYRRRQAPDYAELQRVTRRSY